MNDKPDMRFTEGCYFNVARSCIAKILEACQCSQMRAAGLRWGWTDSGMRRSWYVWETPPDDCRDFFQ